MSRAVSCHFAECPNTGTRSIPHFGTYCDDHVEKAKYHADLAAIGHRGRSEARVDLVAENVEPEPPIDRPANPVQLELIQGDPS